MSANALDAGDLGSAWFTKFNLNDARLDSEASIRAAAISALQSLIAQQALVTPAYGNYTSPAGGGVQNYGANATPWATANSAGKCLIIASPPTSGSPHLAGSGDLFNWAGAQDYVVTMDSNVASALPVYTLRLLQRTAGVPSVLASCTLTIPSGVTSSGTLSATISPIVVWACPISTSAMKMLVSFAYQVQGSTYWNYYTVEFLIAWNGTTLSQTSATAYTLASGATPYNSGYVTTPASGNRRGVLMGSASILAQSLTIVQGAYLWDRLNDALTYGVFAAGMSMDIVAPAMVIRAAYTATPTDNVARATVWLEQYNDNGATRLSTLRITGKTYGSIQGIYALSSTLAILQFTDASSVKWAYAIAINATTGAMTLYGPYSSGNLAVNSFSFPVSTYSATYGYFIRQNTATTAKLMQVNFNVANTGNELTSPTASDVTITLGAGIAGLTAATLISSWQCGPDQIAVMYYAAASTSAIYVEVFNLT